MAFEDNVFVNCPFDEAYVPLLRPLLFTVIYLRLKPRIAFERSDSGEPRIDKILQLVRESKYAIHDLSRMKSKVAGEVFRLNMPFELGIDVGCRTYGAGKKSKKRCLILEAERFSCKAAISDLSGSDIAVHADEPEKVVVEVRNWLANQCRPSAQGPARIWGAFNEFMAANYDELTARGFSKSDIVNFPIPELIACMERWAGENR